MANVNIPDLTSLTAPATGDEMEIYDASASENKRLALSYMVRDTGGTGAIVTGGYTLTLPATGTAALIGSAQTFPALQTFGAGLIVSGGSSGAGRIYKTAGDGLVIWSPSGSSTDFVLAGSGGTNALSVPNGTNHTVFGAGTDSGQVTIKSSATGTITLVTDTPASPTANLAEFRNNGTAKLKIGTQGLLDFTGTMGNSTKTVGTDAPADWVQVAIGGTTYYLPAYAA